MEETKLNIIIADDNRNFLRAFRFTIEETLGDRINAVYEASNGLECLVIVEKYPINLIFIDINMPIMDGIEAIKRIKSLNKEIKVVAVSFHKEQEYIKQAIEAGARSYLVKENISREILLDIF